MSAPGKVVILGEYGVLEGGPALSIAINRRARATLTPNGRDHCRVRSHDASLPAAAFRLSTSGRLAWLGAAARGHYAVLEAAVTALAREDLLAWENPPGFDVHLDSRGFFHPRRAGAGAAKLGLGSSAALMIALATALYAHSGGPPLSAREWVRIGLAAHRDLQGDVGSGVDVATSVYGGVVTYRLTPLGPETRRVALPADLGYRFVWTGRGASTADFLKRLRVWAAAHPRQYAAVMRELAAMAADGVAALNAAGAARLLEQTSRFTACLDRFAKMTGLAIYAHHGEIRKVAKNLGVLYKPCGAGGADIGLAMSLDRERLQELTIRLGELNYSIVPLDLDNQGPIHSKPGVSA